MPPTNQNGTARRNGSANGSGERWFNTHCPYCGVGCGLQIGVQTELHTDKVVRVKGDPDHPSTRGELCLKPIHLPAALYSEDRVLHPQMRLTPDGPLERVRWEDAIEHVALSFQQIAAEYGPDAIAFYGSGQFTTEDYYVSNKLLKGFIGTNNFDANSRLCMASAVAGYTKSLGSDGPPPAYADIDEADCFFLIGTNTADCHPVLFNRIKRRKKSGGSDVCVIVVDPRHTRTAEIADIFLPIQPGSDVALLNGMLHVMLREGLIDADFIAAHTNDFEAVRASVEAYPPERAAELCGIEVEHLLAAARAFGNARAVLSFWSMGLNQSINGVAKNTAVINLHLATGQIGRPGCGPFSLTGQPNAMGGREAGGLCHILPGYRQVANPEHRAQVEAAWGLAPGAIAEKPGLATVEMFEAAARGEIKALWVMCSNPLVSMPNIELVEAAVRNLELFVVTDAYHPTDTTQFAHVLLPAAQWSERDGVMTNSERRITYLPKMVEPPGEARPDWQIVTGVAQAMGFGDTFAYERAEDIFNEFVGLTAGRLCDYSGVSYARLQQEGPLQWPVPAPDHPGTRHLYSGAETGELRFPTPNGRANFLVSEHQEVHEPVDAEFPLTLTTGRVRNQWHTMTRTGKSDSLLKGASEPFLEINTRDARARNIDDGDMLEIRSRRGVAWAKARVTDKIRRGTCFMPFHWGRLAGRHKAANNITLEAVDPVSQEPELKACAVEVRVRPGYRLLTTSPVFQRLGKVLSSD